MRAIFIPDGKEYSVYVTDFVPAKDVDGDPCCWFMTDEIIACHPSRFDAIRPMLVIQE